MIRRPHFQTATLTLDEDMATALREGMAVRLPEVTLQRRISAGFWVATGTFLAILLLIALGTLHNAMAALLGAAVVLGVSLVGRPLSEDLFIFSFEQALSYVDFNVIFLVMGMMIVIGIIEETGVFQWTAYQAYRLSRGRAWLLAIILMVVTAVASALLDNVTTMLLMAPITLQIALALGIDPLSLLLPEVLASNVGGISTLIGTPTNILIGSYAHIGFNDFLINLTPGVVLALAVLTGYVLAVYWKEYRKAGARLSSGLLDRLRENARIMEPGLLCKMGVVFTGMLVLFVLGERLHLPPAVTAILGAVAALLWAKPDIEEMLQVVDWTTLIFFIALFIVIGAIEEVGLISTVALGIKRVVGPNLDLAMAIFTGSAALASGVVDNIPFAAAMLPVAGYLTRQ
ncbi:MAG: TRAP transporter large permease subunit, partial [Anaerolineae bacterium]|nr:TRAP transporter large permease subunit [Anaerolineae bacterium]